MDALLFSPHAQPGQNRALAGGNRSPMRGDPGRHHSWRAALPGISHDQPERQGPAIVATNGPGGNAARVFDCTAILIYLAEKTGKLLGGPEGCPEFSRRIIQRRKCHAGVRGHRQPCIAPHRAAPLADPRDTCISQPRWRLSGSSGVSYDQVIYLLGAGHEHRFIVGLIDPGHGIYSRIYTIGRARRREHIPLTIRTFIDFWLEHCGATPGHAPAGSKSR
jgi:hypothetical protein